MTHFHREKTLAAPSPTGPKPKLEMEQLPIFRVHCRKLEAYFCQVFHWDNFDFLMATGTTPGLAPEYRVGTPLSPGGDAARRASMLRSGRQTREVALILSVLCTDGYIPAGTYTVDTRPETPPLEIYKALLRKTGTPESKECREFRAAHRHDRDFTRTAAGIDTQVLQTLKEMNGADA